jgi:6-phosphofructokinase 1
MLSGTGKALEIAVKNEIGCKVRSVELNISQRCAAHIASGEDIEDSVRIGREAVRAAANGVSREMMTYVREADNSFSISHSDVMVIANQIKEVPADYINERGNHVTDACCSYILPLIQGEATPSYKNGIPEFVIL